MNKIPLLATQIRGWASAICASLMIAEPTALAAPGTTGGVFVLGAHSSGVTPSIENRPIEVINVAIGIVAPLLARNLYSCLNETSSNYTQ